MENAGELLAAGLTFGNVVSAKISHPRADFAAMNEVYREFFRRAARARDRAIGACRTRSGRGDHVRGFLAARKAIGTPPSGLPLSPAIRAGQHLFVSGMLGNTADTAADVAAQARLTLQDRRDAP